MARRRANAEGSVFKNEARGRWEAVLVVGWTYVDKHGEPLLDAAGNPRRTPIRKTFTGKTQRAVTARLDDARKAMNEGLEVPDNRTTIDNFAAWWRREVLVGEGLAPRTERWYCEMLDTYVLPLVGAKALTGPRALTIGDVEAMTTALDRRGLSPRVQIAARTTLGKVLQAALQRGLLTRNVARLAKPPRDRGRARAVKALTVAQLERVLAALAGTRWHPVVLVGTATGVRPSELLALHWADIQLDGREPQVSVRHALTHTDGPALKAPKRARSYRTVPLPSEAVTALRAWRKEQAAERLAAGPLYATGWPDLVFTSATGTPVRVDTFRHALKRLIDERNADELAAWENAGRRGRAPEPIPHMHPHMARHTYGSHLIQAGVPIAHVAELLGDTVAVVEGTYSHILRPKHETAAIASGLFGG